MQARFYPLGLLMTLSAFAAGVPESDDQQAFYAGNNMKGFRFRGEVNFLA